MVPVDNQTITLLAYYPNSFRLWDRSGPRVSEGDRVARDWRFLAEHLEGVGGDSTFKCNLDINIPLP